MSLSAGFVGLPNVGKSTLFNTITNSRAEAANYPFATIEPNVGYVNLKDIRLDNLQKMVEPEKVVPTSFKFVDIAGLVKGASKGEGLGNQFLSNIRDVDAICHLVRCFQDKDITHVHNAVDAVYDAEIINMELVLADLEIISKRIDRIRKKAQVNDKEAKIEFELLSKINDALLDNKFANTVPLTEIEKKMLGSFNLITLKPMVYIGNIAEDEINNPLKNTEFVKLKEYAEANGSVCIPVSAKIEYEISLLDEESKKIFLEELNIASTGLDLIVETTYKLLHLKTYFTVGKKEVRAWTFHDGMNAAQCAGIIHTDFEKGFIKAEVVSYNDLMTYGSEHAAKEHGKVRMEGKNYLMQDGDICFFRFNVTK
ncbi:redox-regulated ATPase YchF [Ureaplasma canigenitalium]|uniref:redox-regulated ATPase YchF n=1 Tax=Ureaplasma canigenitalium TaxID=42092 RepID=UPI0004E23186|nr:redox-regulated ATPase YchF [Ureaplasma canigenitalium]